jgi:hypothetical protein
MNKFMPSLFLTFLLIPPLLFVAESLNELQADAESGLATAQFDLQ